MDIETKTPKSDDLLQRIHKAKSKLATRRAFLKAAGATGMVAAMYTVPRLNTVAVRPAYASITGAGVTVTKNFGELAEATFGGTGIPNDAVAITNISGLPGGISITLGLTATQRFTAPPLTNDGAGVFTAGAGVDADGVRGLWNFDFLMEIVGGTLADCKFCLLYDLDPSTTNSEASLGKIDFNAAVVFFGGTLASTTLIQDSQNSTFGFLAGPLNSWLTPPSFTPFNAAATGEYSFELLAKTNAGVELGRTSMKVKVV